MHKKPKQTDVEQDDIFLEFVAGITPIKNDKVYFPPKKPAASSTPAASSPTTPAQVTPAQVATLDFAEPEIMLTDNFTEIAAEEELFFARSGLQTKVIRKLRRGQFPIGRSLDLHGFTIQEAKQELWQFLQQCLDANMRHVIVVHGKGRHSEEQKVTIKDAVNCWLKQMPEVLAFCSAQSKDGGRGALYVLLKRRKGADDAE